MLKRYMIIAIIALSIGCATTPVSHEQGGNATQESSFWGFVDVVGAVCDIVLIFTDDDNSTKVVE